MRLSSCEVLFHFKPTLQRLGRHIKLRFQVSVLSLGGGGLGWVGVGGWSGEIPAELELGMSLAISKKISTKTVT